MQQLQLKIDPRVVEIFEKYPKTVRPRLERLRNLIIETARELADVAVLEETLKWGEPSYLTKKGSTIRIDWKEGKPEQYAMYFQCTSSLVPTFRIMYKDTFTFEGNRAIIFQINEKIPENELKNCIAVGLRYHKIKKLPLLGL